MKDQLVALNIGQYAGGGCRPYPLFQNSVTLAEPNVLTTPLLLPKRAGRTKELKSQIVVPGRYQGWLLAIQILFRFHRWGRCLYGTPIIKDSIDYHGKIEFNRGYVPDAGEVFGPPATHIYINEDAILILMKLFSIKHPIPDVINPYTINDIPTVVHPLFMKNQIHISAYTTIKARAVKEGWLKSR